MDNSEFLNAIFGQFVGNAHVTDFIYDPAEIPADRHLMCWKGDYFSRHKFTEGSNQYFTISTFSPDEKGVARRRKALYQRTHCIVLDDVKEKLNLEEVNRLPAPSWVLETSKGSEQWGYILTEPCTERHQVENLLDGLVANGLAPDGRDPGMKGVTRYVRLPDGYNTKSNRFIDGKPYKCQMLQWNPFNTVTMQQLATPFNVDLNRERRESRVDGATAINDHPLLDIADIVRIKEVRSDGRFDITCPWVEGHTGGDDSGTAVFTNGDGTIGFKCHHGSCQDRTGRDLLNEIEEQEPGFKQRLSAWQAMRILADVRQSVSEPSFMAPPPTNTQAVAEQDPISAIHDLLRREIPDSREQLAIAEKLLKMVDSLSAMEQVSWHGKIRDTMRWSKVEFSAILKASREQWYSKTKEDVSFFDEVIFIAEANQFYDRSKRIFYTPEAYQNAYSHLDGEARKEALTGGRVVKVDKLDYAPKMPPVFKERGITYGNSWSTASEMQGAPGDCSPWLNHFDVIGWGDHKKHILQWLAFTVLHPDIKINHMLTLGSDEGTGKDFLLYPLVKAMGDNAHTISGDELLSDFNDYLLGTKFLLVNETELGDHRDAQVINARLKPLAAAPPERLNVNQKGIKKINVRNILSVVMTTNSPVPFKLSGQSRRIFAIWSELKTRDATGTMTQEWVNYWTESWEWMKQGGFEHCIDYLRNHVDLSDFNPGTPPPMTEFLQDIQEASKSPQQQTVEAFIEERVGQFNCDLITVKDAVRILRAGETFKPELMYARSEWFTPVKVGTLMNGITNITKMNAYDGKKRQHVYCLRDYMKYSNMSASELWSEHERQRGAAPRDSLTVVK